MMLTHPKMRWPIGLVIASLLVGASVFHFSLNLHLAAQKRLIAEQSSAERAKHGVEKAPARLIQDQAEAALYSRIRESGFMGPENRDGWISALAQTQRQMQLTSLAWRISPQAPSTLKPDLFVSQMAFTASPLDPTRLTQLLAHLRASAPGRFTVDQCTLNLDAGSMAGQVNCQLAWWTLAQDDN